MHIFYFIKKYFIILISFLLFNLSCSNTVKKDNSSLELNPQMGTIADAQINEDEPGSISVNVSGISKYFTCSDTYLEYEVENTILFSELTINWSGTSPNCIGEIIPPENIFGETQITISALDNGEKVVSQSFGLTVNSVNDLPEIVLSEITVDEGLEVVFLESHIHASDIEDTDPANVTLTVTGVPASGLLKNTGVGIGIGDVFSQQDINDGLISYEHDGSETLTDAFELRVSDTEGAFIVETIDLTINPVNDDPELTGLVSLYTIDEDQNFVISFTISDVDSELSCSTSISIDSENQSLIPNGNVIFGGSIPDCTATITPVSNSNGTSNTSFILNDGDGGVVTETVSLTVNPVNDSPTISAISDASTNKNESFEVSFTIGDVDNILSCDSSLTLTSLDQSLVSNGSVVWGGTYPNCSATITPEVDAYGTTNLTVVVSDGSLTSESIFGLTVNYPPEISDILDQTIDEDTSLEVAFTAVDEDSTLACTSDYLTMTTSDTTLIANSNVVWSGTIPNCLASITPNENKNGSLTVTITLGNGATGIAEDSFVLTINPVNDPPQLSELSNGSTDEDVPYVLPFTLSDVDNDLSCTTSVSMVSDNTSLVPNTNVAWSGTAPDCTATITPVENEFGVTNITFTATDGLLDDIKTFALTVNSVNDAPQIITDIPDSTIDEDAQLDINFEIFDVENEVDCSAGSLSISSDNTTLLPNTNVVWGGVYPNCSATITPSANGNGIANISLNITDGTDSSSKTFLLTVNSINDDPVISSILDQVTDEDIPIGINFTISDVDNTLDCQTSVSMLSDNTALVPNTNVVWSGTSPDCVGTITPALDENGLANITFTVSDGTAAATSSFALTVNVVNDSPVISTNVGLTLDEGSSSVIQTANLESSDVDDISSNLTYLLSTVPLSGTILKGGVPLLQFDSFTQADINGNLITYEHDGSETFIDSFDFDVSDGNTSVSGTFLFTINPVNDDPFISVNENIVLDEGGSSVITNLNLKAEDPEQISSELIFTITVDVSNGELYKSGVLMSVGDSFTQLDIDNEFISYIHDSGETISDSFDFDLSDGVGGTLLGTTFSITVNPVNDPPTIEVILDQETHMNNDTDFIDVVINDVDSALECTSAFLSISSDNEILIPSLNVVWAGTVPNCTAVITPAVDQFGEANITVTVLDNDGESASTPFVLTVFDEITGWSTKNGNGLNVDINYQAMSPSVAIDNGILYAAWSEADVSGVGQIRVAAYSDETGLWNTVDGGGVSGINYSTSQIAISPVLISFNGKLYVGWVENLDGDTLPTVRIAVFDGVDTFNFVDGNGVLGLNGGRELELVEYNLELYAIFVEDSEIKQLVIRKYNGDDLAPSWTSKTYLNYDSLKDAEYPKAGTHDFGEGEKLFITWEEAKPSQIRLASFDGIAWSFDDGGISTGLNFNTLNPARNPVLLSTPGGLYISWSEESAPYAHDGQIRLMLYDGSSFSFVGGIVNYDSLSVADYPQLAYHKGEIYVTWEEGNPFQIRVANLELDSTWNYVELAEGVGLNIDSAINAYNPKIIEHNTNLFVIWDEDYTIRVKQAVWNNAE